MAQYDVAHIDTIRYRELRRMVLDGRARAVITIEFLDAIASSLVEFPECLNDAKTARADADGLTG